MCQRIEALGELLVDGHISVRDLGGIGSFLAVLLPFLFVLTVVVFIHELGHFLVARWCGVKVKAFSIGFGREIFGFYDRHGTRWRFAWIPLGGYVKFLDDENSASVPSKAALDEHDAGPSARAPSRPSRWRRARPSSRPGRWPISCWRSSSSR